MAYTETDMEIIKSYAYGYTPEQVAEHYRITVADAENMQKAYASDIEERKKALKNGGYR